MQKWEKLELFHLFEVYGVNPLMAFVDSGLLAKCMYMIKLNLDGEKKSITSILYHFVYEPLLGADFGSLAFALTHVLFWYIVLKMMYKKKIYDTT